MPRKESPMKLKTTGADRLALKRKAMATLTAAKKTDKGHRSGKMFKKALSEGELMKRKVMEWSESEIDTDVDVVTNDESESEHIDVVNTDVDSIIDNVDDDDEESPACELEHSIGLCGCFELNPIVNDNSCDCFGCFDNLIDDPFECSSKFQHDINNNSETVGKMMAEFDNNLMYCYTNTPTQEAEIVDMNESCDSNIDVVNFSMEDDVLGTLDTDEIFNDFDKTVCSIGKDKVSAHFEYNQMLDNTDNTDKTETKVNTETCQPDMSIPVQKTDVAFVSSLFKPLPSDLDESIDISVLEEVSMDDSIDLDEMLNFDETEELSLVDPEAVKEIVSENNGKWQLDNQSSKDDPDLNNNLLDNKQKSYIETKVGHGYKETIQQIDINNNSMFKPAFNTSPKPLFGGIIDFPSGITPKAKPSIVGPAIITQDHAYSKIKKPVHFSLRSRTLKCKEVQSLFMGSQSVSVVKSLSPLNCIPLKGLNTCHQNSTKVETSLGPGKETIEIANGNTLEMFKQTDSNGTPSVNGRIENDFNETSNEREEREEKIDDKNADAHHVNELLDCKRGDKKPKELVQTLGHVGSVTYNNQNEDKLVTWETRAGPGAKEGIQSVKAGRSADHRKDGSRSFESELGFIRELRGRKVLQVV